MKKGKIGAILLALALILGLIGAVLFRKHNYIRNYKACKSGAIAGFIFLAVILLLLVVLIILAVV